MRRNIKCLLLVLIICTLAFFGIQEIRALDWEEDGNSNLGSFNSCSTDNPQFNGCIGRVGFRFTVIKDIKQANEQLSYTQKGNSTNYIISVDVSNYWGSVKDNVLKDYKTILANAKVTEAEFFNNENGYAILVEPLYDIYYWPGWQSQDTPGEQINEGSYTSYAAADRIKKLIVDKSNKDLSNIDIYDGWHNVVYMLLCDLYISSTDSTDKFCSRSPEEFGYETNGRKELLEEITNRGKYGLYGKGLIYASEMPNPPGELVVQKYNLSIPRKLITSPAEFNIYNGSSCSGTVIKSIRTNNGTASISLPFGTYSINEKTAPTNYEKSDDCKTFSIIPSGSVTVKFYNSYGNGEGSCQAKLEEIKSRANYNNIYSRMSLLINAYIEFDKKGVKYKGLLNFNNPSCSSINSTTTTTSGCLSGSIKKSGFSQENWSNFDTFGYNIGGNYGYYYACSNDFEFTNYIKWPSTDNKKFLGDFKSGQIWLSSKFSNKGEAIGTGKLTTTCFSYVYGTSEKFREEAASQLMKILNNPSSNYYNYIRRNNAVQIVADDDDYNAGYLIPSTSVASSAYPPVISSNKTEGIYNFAYSASLDYNLPRICAVKGTGAVKKNSVCNAPIPPMTMLGYGFTINFDAKTKLYFPKFKVYNKAGDVIISSQCYFGVTNDITTPNGKELNIEFRSVEPNEPFPGQSGNSRNPGTNWSILSLDANKDGQINMNDWASVVRTSSNSTLDYNFILKYDFNKNGVVGDEDLTTLRNIISKYVSNGTDTYADTLLQNTPNSYGLIPSTGERKEAKYTIVLTPNDIKTIRNDNNHYQYGLNVSCNDDKCTSSFLTTLTNRNSDSGSKVLVIKNSLKRDNK